MSNHIDHIEITNFKSIRHMKIDGCKRINVFIGYPNVGKSNILEALGMFTLPYLKIAGSKKLSDFIRLKNLPGLFYGTDTTTPVQVKINEDELIFSGIYDRSAFYPLECEYLYKGDNSDTAIKSPLLKPKMFFDDDLNVKFENLPNKIGGFGKFEILKYHFNIDKLKPKKTSFSTLIPPFGNNLYNVIAENDELRNFVKEEFEKIGGEYIYDTEDNVGKILKENNGKIFTLPISSIADTLQRLIFYMAAIVSNKNSVLLFEEPEAHMFPPYISKLSGDIIFDKQNDNQYFINTHSPFVIGEFLEDAREDLSVYLVDYKDNETIIKKLSGEELHEVYQYGVDLFFNIQSYLD